MNSLVENKRQRLKLILCSSVIWSVIAHGMALFNKYSFHDDAWSINTVGVTYSSGRWMLGILDETVKFLFGSCHTSIPVFNGLVTILCIALAVFLISERMGINSKKANVLLCGTFVTFPTVTGSFGYMFTAPYYFLAHYWEFWARICFFRANGYCQLFYVLF